VALVRALAAGQHFVVSRSQLQQLGFSKTGIHRWVRSGRLTPVLPGVYAFEGPLRTAEAKAMAAVAWGGDGAALSHVSAAHLFDVWRGPKQDVVDVVSPRQRTDRYNVRFHQSRRLERAIEVLDEIPITSLSRTIVDLAEVLTPHQVANVIHQACYRHKLDIVRVEAWYERLKDRHSAPVARRAIDLHVSGSAGTRSMDEDRFVALMAPVAPEPQVCMVQAVGVDTHEADAYWPEQRVWVVIDGATSHGRPNDKAREQGLADGCTAAGITLIRFQGWEVRRRPDRVRRTVLAALHAR
jgi:hypothetical protein